MRKINVVGTSGSGKTTFARRLAAQLGFSYIEIDKVYWKANWSEPSDAEFFPKLDAALRGDQWVLDGNYHRTIPIKWAYADTVVWLDFSFARTVYQCLKRSVRRAVTRVELWEGTGNRESFTRTFFNKESIVWWTITTHGRMRRQYLACMSDSRFAHIRFVRLRSPHEAEGFLQSIEHA